MRLWCLIIQRKWTFRRVKGAWWRKKLWRKSVLPRAGRKISLIGSKVVDAASTWISKHTAAIDNSISHVQVPFCRGMSRHNDASRSSWKFHSALQDLFHPLGTDEIVLLPVVLLLVVRLSCDPSTSVSIHRNDIINIGEGSPYRRFAGGNWLYGIPVKIVSRID